MVAMPRILRFDGPGKFFHVMNHAVEEGNLFTSTEDARAFLCPLAKEVKKRRLRVFSYCLMPNHYHLLVESTAGELSRAMQMVQQKFSLWFNRRYDRRGALFRSRFKSVQISTSEYLWVLLAYIDQNPVKAGIVSNPVEYPFGSAFLHGKGTVPPWLSTDLPGGMGDEYLRFMEMRGGEGGGPGCSVRKLTSDLEWLVEKWVEGETKEGCGLEEIGSMKAREWQDWLKKEAEKKPRRSYPAVLPPGPLLEALDEIEKMAPDWKVGRPGREIPGWPVMKAGLLRMVVGQSFGEIQARLGLCEGGAWFLWRKHRELLVKSETYLVRAGAVLQKATSMIFNVEVNSL